MTLGCEAPDLDPPSEEFTFTINGEEIASDGTGSETNLPHGMLIHDEAIIWIYTFGWEWGNVWVKQGTKTIINPN